MAISVYTGVMGSGKTYEVVRYVIAPALAAGRRVVTNIAGFDYDEACEFCVERLGGKPGQIGEILVVDDDAVQSPSFFPAEDAATSTVRPGDLVVIDECWRFWGADAPISDADLEFFRKHRHLTDPVSGVACDLVVITQAVPDLHRKLKNVIELSFRAKKAKSLGLTSIYVVEMWEGVNQRRKSASAQTRKYDPAVFPLYKSYSGATGAAGREVAVDSRQNILKSWRFMLIMPAALGFLIFAVWNTYSFFAPKSAPIAAAPEIGMQEPIGVGATVKGDRVAIAAAVPVRAVAPSPSPSGEWRLSGFVSFGERRVVLVINNAGRVRYVSPSMFRFSDGRPVSGVVDGELVTEWTGLLHGVSASGMSERSLIPFGEGGR